MAVSLDPFNAQDILTHNMDHTVTAVGSAFYRYGTLLGACLGLICGLYLCRRYLLKLQLGIGIRVLAVISCIFTGAVLGVVTGSVLAEVHACFQGSVASLPMNRP